ncbi:pyrimidine/purine nucleoside phosphorylase [Acidobacteriota bacterium]
MYKVNEYYDGKIKSLSFEMPDGPASVGVIAIGEYEFGTSTKEFLTVTSGKLIIKEEESPEWIEYGPNETFVIDANKKFYIKAEEITSYLCLYR